MADWTGIFVVFGVAILVFLLKYIIIRCYLTACGRQRNLPVSNTDGVGRRSRESIIIGPSYSLLLVTTHPCCINPRPISSDLNLDILGANHQSRLATVRGRKPPPKFETALKCSSPVSFIDVVDEGPPPTYEEYLAMTRNNPAHLPPVIVIPQVHKSITYQESMKSLSLSEPKD